MTIQTEIAAKLASLGIAHKEIKVYGSQIVVTCWGREAADRFAAVIANFAKVRGVLKALDQNEASKGRKPEWHEVHRVFAAI